MKQLILLSIFISSAVFGQKDNTKSIYKDLPVKKFYTVNTETVSENGSIIYKAGGKVIDKVTFDKYAEARKNPENCKPCILETYDANEILVSKAVKYKDCPVGYWYNYYPSGKIKTIGHYRENESDVWDPLWDAGYCMKHGTWTEYDEKGKVKSFETYDFGNLKVSKAKKSKKK